jgi:hypothetical protein
VWFWESALGSVQQRHSCRTWPGTRVCCAETHLGAWKWSRPSSVRSVVMKPTSRVVRASQLLLCIMSHYVPCDRQLSDIRSAA